MDAGEERKRAAEAVDGEVADGGERKKSRVSRWQTAKGADSNGSSNILPTPSAALSASEAAQLAAPTTTTNLMNMDAAEKARRAAAISAQIQQQLATLGKAGFVPGNLVGGGAAAVAASASAPIVPGVAVAGAKTANFMPPPLILDSSGKAVDALGAVMNIKVDRVATLKANQRKLEEEKKKGDPSAPSAAGTVKENPYLAAAVDDPIASLPSRKPRRAFHFVEDGRYSRQAETIRARAALYEYTASHLKSKEGGGQAAAAAAPVAPPPPGVAPDADLLSLPKLVAPVPAAEWWDKVILRHGSYLTDVTAHKCDVIADRITNLVEHPIPLPPPIEKVPAAMPMFLTKEEQKKLRRRTRQEKQRQLSELQQAGLAPVPENKIKISNMMRVLGSEAAADPTKIEAEVRRQIAARLKAHNDRNEANKLTKEERRAKKLRKVEEDMKAEMQCVLFKVPSLGSKAVRMKIDKNVQYMHLRGCAIIHEDCSIVLVEGGKKMMRKFVKLIGRRIKWESTEENDDDSDSDESDDEEEEAKKNKAILVWQGTIKEFTFSDFQFQLLNNDAAARAYMEGKGKAHFWDMARNYRAPDE